MADIGALPTRTTVRITSSTGDFGTIPAVTPRSAGVMTAEQAERLETIWQWHQTMQSGGGSLVIQHASPDLSQYPTRMEIQQALQSLPRGADSTPALAALRSQVNDLQRQLRDAATQALNSPPIIHQETGETIDSRARAVLQGVIEGMAGLDDRLAQVETVIDVLRRVAEQKASIKEEQVA